MRTGFRKYANVFTTETQKTQSNSNLTLAPVIHRDKCKGCLFLLPQGLIEKIGEPASIIEQGDLGVRWFDLRRRQTWNLPICGISREWAKTLFSVPSATLWWKKVCERHHEKSDWGIGRI